MQGTLIWGFFLGVRGGRAKGWREDPNSTPLAGSEVTTEVCVTETLEEKNAHVLLHQSGRICVIYCIVLIFCGSKFSQFSRIRCHLRKYFTENFDTLHYHLLLQCIRETFSMKLSKTRIPENLDPQNISTIQYCVLFSKPPGLIAWQEKTSSQPTECCRMSSL